jgi:hypothetical protein
MILGIQGSNEFNDYSIFLSGMALALRKMDALDSEDKEITIFSAGPKRVGEMGMEFVNVSDFKSRGIKARVVKVPEAWFKNSFHQVSMFLYFCNEKQPFSKLSEFLDQKEVDVQIMRYRAVKK